MIDIEVLRLALSKEEDAIKTYQGMLVGRPNLKELLSFLITEEEKHRMLIQEKISEMESF